MMDKITVLLARFAYRSDVVIAVLVLVAITMMVFPLPTWLVDLLITFNIAFSVLILLASLHAANPLQFSAMPAVILIATLFRLAITITTTRLILLQADAGNIVTAFGNFVVGGSIAVGLIIFFIITIAQFVVIAKGAERVAEVAARFTLDALPGKQMSIDAALRNGDIDQTQARVMRLALERESQFFGAMDGAMKFVKGDVLAGIVIILVNLVGGFAVGMLQNGMGFAEAAATYSLLSVGDGLVSQIPALLVAVAAGTMVTRVAGNEDENDLGRQIASQLLRDSRSLTIASAIMFVLALVPGFPTFIFIVLGAIFGVASYAMHRGRRDESPEDQPHIHLRRVDDREEEPLALASAPSESALRLDLGTSLAQEISQSVLERLESEARSELASDLGLEPPTVRRAVDPTLRPRQIRINLDDVPVFDMDIPSDCVLVDEDPVHLQLLGLSSEDSIPVRGLKRVRLVTGGRQAELAEAGIAFLTPERIPGRLLAHVYRKYAAHFIGLQETQNLLLEIEKSHSALVAQVRQTAPIARIAEVLRQLVAEGVTIRNLRVIFEAIVEAGGVEADQLTEKVRIALKRQISFRAADRDNIIAAFLLERTAEQDVRDAVQVTEAGRTLDLSDRALASIARQVEQAVSQSSAETAPVVVTAGDIRPQLHALLLHYGIEIAVLSYQELAPEFNVQPLGTIAGSGPRKVGQGKLAAPSQGAGHTQQ